MARNSENPFSDESVNPAERDPTDESVHGSPRGFPKKNTPPLPKVETDTGASPPMVPQSGNPTYVEPTREPAQPTRSPKPAPPRLLPIRRKFSWKALFTWPLIAAFSLLVCAYIWNTRQQMALEARELLFKSAEVKTTLSCSNDWQELGFILRPGDQVVITAEGEYLNSMGGRTDGDGFVDSGGEQQGLRSYEPLFPHGCLIARTSGRPGQVFHIGKGGVLRTGKGGRLHVRINDLDLKGNRGVLRVKARTFLNDPPDGIQFRGSRDSGVTPILR